MIDLWYGDRPADIDRLDVYFNDLSAKYQGNLYREGKAVGDFSVADLATLEKAFPQLIFVWND